MEATLNKKTEDNPRKAMSFWIDAELLARFKDLSIQRGISMSQSVECFILDEVEKSGQTYEWKPAKKGKRAKKL
ncbi:hypothetical protein [Nostoc sp. CCY 9925]|uniref:hypothetical protein n=1 Tax=Nostoc sp. CCY 9925 TaxID=3103865 RepID=UPI0039C6EE73